MKVAVLTVPGIVSSDPEPEWRALTAAIDAHLAGTSVEAVHDLGAPV